MTLKLLTIFSTKNSLVPPPETEAEGSIRIQITLVFFIGAVTSHRTFLCWFPKW